ncbi:acetyltransferase-like isoleucine patch superfamily enzyme/VanZ family protein [Arthrobacter oryzae]|nr:acetyltransferase-like isoleucine patch superfamily enzyme/VanZ family protein [Arthrobacter oryzae]
MSAPARRRMLVVLFGIYIAALAGIAFWPSPVDRPLAGFLKDVLAALHQYDLTAGLRYSHVEGAANVALFMPIGLLVTQFVSRRRWWLAVATGLMTSAAIESVQFLLLSERHASLRDVVNNTLGALLGALVARVVRPRRRATQSLPGADSSPTDSGRSDMITIANTADVADTASIGDGTRIWHLAQIREDAALGTNCNIGRGAYVGPAVQLGDNCKLQNYALVYEPARLSDGVFIGPAAVLTNDLHPRAITPDGVLKGVDDWEAVGVTVGKGASVGARAVCVAPLVIGEWATVAAGAVVTRNVPAYAVVAGVPARQMGWVGEAGHPLKQDDGGSWLCPATGRRYLETNGQLVPVEAY